jgi:hypothetical protein
MPWDNVMDEERLDRLGTVADNLDSALHMLRVPLPAQTHLEGLAASMRKARDEIAGIVREVSGDDPWETNPLEG